MNSNCNEFSHCHFLIVQNGWAPLSLACIEGQNAAVKVLLARGADTEAPDKVSSGWELGYGSTAYTSGVTPSTQKSFFCDICPPYSLAYPWPRTAVQP